MHPLLTSFKRALSLLAFWLILTAGMLLSLHALTTGGWLPLAVLAFPLFLLELFLLLAVYYICKSFPLRASQLHLLISKHLAIAVLSVGSWLFVGMIYSVSLSMISGDESWSLLFKQMMPVLIVSGVFFYIAAVLLYYLFIEMNRAHQAEQQALRLKLQASKAEYNALKLSVHPHFLFNSFAALAALIQTDPDKAAEVMHRLSDFLRTSLNYGEQDWTTVSDELAYVKSYLVLESIRLGKRLRYEFYVGDMLGEIPLPTFTLLPLIENAVKHGIEPSINGGKVSLRIHRNKFELRIEVENPQTSMPASGRENGFGLSALRKRLESIYKTSVLLEQRTMGESMFATKLYLPVTGEAGRPAE